MAHKVRRLGASFANPSGFCDGCCVLFHDRRRLIQHLNTCSKTCLAAYIAVAQPHDDDTTKALEAADRKASKGKHRFAAMPAVKIEGPALPPPCEFARVAACADGIAPTTLFPPLVPQSPFRIPIAPNDSPLIFVSLCSGLRREQDPQWYMERQASAANLPILIISLHIAMDDSRFIQWALAGRLIGIVMGPPCETWTVARFMELVGRLSAPRPLGSASTPIGLPDVSKRELAQVGVGNDILLLSFLLFFLVMMTGGTALMEHPSDPVARQPEAPSIWRLGITQTLIAMGARIVYIDQCRYGSPSRKPTMLLTCNAR